MHFLLLLLLLSYAVHSIWDTALMSSSCSFRGSHTSFGCTVAPSHCLEINEAIKPNSTASEEKMGRWEPWLFQVPLHIYSALEIWRHLGKPGYEVGCQRHVIDSTSVVLEREERWQRIWALGRKNASVIAFSQGICYEAGRGDWNIKLPRIKSGLSDLELV